MSSVYVIAAKEEGPCKLGRANNPITRLADLQTGHAAKLNLVTAVSSQTAFEIETALHKRFRTRKLHGEWFSITTAEAQAALLALVSPTTVDRRSDQEVSAALSELEAKQAKRRAQVLEAVRRYRAKRRKKDK